MMWGMPIFQPPPMGTATPDKVLQMYSFTSASGGYRLQWGALQSPLPQLVSFSGSVAVTDVGGGTTNLTRSFRLTDVQWFNQQPYGDYFQVGVSTHMAVSGAYSGSTVSMSGGWAATPKPDTGEWDGYATSYFPSNFAFNITTRLLSTDGYLFNLDYSSDKATITPPSNKSVNVMVIAMVTS